MSFSTADYLAMQARCVHNRTKADFVEASNGEDVNEVGKGGLHEQIEAELRTRRWYYVHSRTDRRTTNQLGTPDFIIAKNGDAPETIWLEVKRPGGKLTKEQTIIRHVLLSLGHRHEIVHSMKEFLECINSSRSL